MGVSLPRQVRDGSGAVIDRTGQGLRRVTRSVTLPIKK
jgi:hypothetical protein